MKTWCWIQLLVMVFCILSGAFLGCPFQCCDWQDESVTRLQADHSDESESHHFCSSLSCGFGNLYLFQTADISMFTVSDPVIPGKEHFALKPVIQDIFRPPIA